MRMHSPETTSDPVLPLKVKTIFHNASTTPPYTDNQQYLFLLTLSLAITSPSLLSHQTCPNANPPPRATSHTQTMNKICAEVMAKPPAITSLILIQMMMAENSLYTFLRTLSSSKLLPPLNHYKTPIARL